VVAAPEHKDIEFAAWKQGHQPPPFAVTNEAAMQLLASLVDGSVDRVPTIALFAFLAHSHALTAYAAV